MAIKAKKQKTTGFVLLSGGIVSFSVGYIIGKTGGSYYGPGAMMMTGVCMLIACLPVLSHSLENRKKALGITGSLKMETSPIIQKGSFVQKGFPALSVKVNLR